MYIIRIVLWTRLVQRVGFGLIDALSILSRDNSSFM
jgi:hypothetical protein